jgi:hypothetical protein
VDGGVPPLGYGVQDHKLVMIDRKAEIVRLIFRRYAELGSVRLLKAELEARGINSKSWTSASGRLVGGKPFSRGALYLMLQNRTYLGEIVHRGQFNRANTRRSSISRCGMPFRSSSPAIPQHAAAADERANPASSPACCLMATATA